MKYRYWAMLCLAVMVGMLIGTGSAGAADQGDQGGPGVTYVNNRQWTSTGTVDADRNWSTATNWSGGAPTATDRALFTGFWWGGPKTVILDADTTISDFVLTNSFAIWNFGNSAATLTVTNDFVCSVQYYHAYFWPKLNISNKFWKVRPQDNTLANCYIGGNGNSFLGGMDISFGKVYIYSNSTFKGTIRVAGENEFGTGISDLSGYLSLPFAGYTWSPDCQIVLDKNGQVAIPQAQNFAGLTNIVFNGGKLVLGLNGTVRTNVFSVYSNPNGFEVKHGALVISSDVNLGTNKAIPLILGSRGYYGRLAGEANNVKTQQVERPIILAGSGGISDGYDPAHSASYPMHWAGIVSGPGELIRRGYEGGNKYLSFINGTNTLFTPNTYTGGTRVLSQMFVESLRSMGSGNVAVDTVGRLQLNAAANVAPAATLYIGGSGLGNTFQPAMLELQAEFIPNLTADSTGILALDFTTTATINNWLATNYPGNRWFGCVDANGTFTGTNLVPGAGNVYRIGGAQVPSACWFILDAPGTTNGPLRGSASVEAGIPHNPANLWSMNPTMWFKDENSYAGTTTLHWAATLLAAGTPSEGGRSPLGNTNAPVILRGGDATLRFNGTANANPARKGDLIAHGTSRVRMDGASGATGDLTFASFVRTNGATLTVEDGAGTLGSHAKLKFVSAPTVVNGLAPAYFVGYHAATGGRFLTYDATLGFTNAPWSNIVNAASFPAGLANGTEIVVVSNTACTLLDDPYIGALRMDTNILKGAGTRIAISSGGLRIHQNRYTTTVDLVFGTVSGGTTTKTEAVIWADAGATFGNGFGGVVLGGKIHAAGLTKTGAGVVFLTNNNVGTLSGPIVINQGGLGLRGANVLQGGPLALGSPTNEIILNGGALVGETVSGNVAITNGTGILKIGPAGGLLQADSSSALSLWGMGPSDLEPGNAGPLRFSGGYVQPAWTNATYSGGTIFNSSVRIGNGDGSLGTGPVRINGVAYVDFIIPRTATNMGRFTLEDPRSRLDVQQCRVIIGSLDGKGQVLFGDPYTANTDLTLETGGDNTDSTFYGVIWDYHNEYGNLIKAGTGTFTLYGDNTYHGYTLVTNGTLIVNGSLDNTSSVLVKPGATLGGKGAIGGPVTVEGNGKLSGSLVLETNVTLNGSAQVNMTLNGPNALSDYSQMTVSGGTLNLAGSTLNLTLGFAPTIGQVFKIANNQGTISGQFAQGSTISATYGGKVYAFRIDYADGDGNDITLTVVPQGTVIFIR